MNEELLEDKVKTHEQRINAHSDRLDKLENRQAEMTVKLDNLCSTIDKLAINL
ncbi:hemolysin XhlA family protein, partial [Intestinibacter bartlettii]